MKWREHAELLLRKAGQDEYLLDRKLDDPAAPTEAFGFHAQQAAEKMLKAALALHEIAYPHTHRLADLLDALRTAGVAIPPGFERLRDLTPFAVELRYDPLPEEPEDSLDKGATRNAVRALRGWVEGLMCAGA